MQSRGTEIGDELDLAFGIACRCGNSQHPQAFSPILEPQSSSKHAVARRILENIALAESHHIQAAGHGVGPFLQIVLRVQNDGRSARGTTG